VSARHVALKRWTVTDKSWNKNVVSRGSIVTSVKRLPICAKNSWVLTLMGPSVSSATRKKSWVPLSELYLFLFLTACGLSGTGTGDGTLLQISVSQSVDHCDVPSGAALRVPWQQCQAVRPLASSRTSPCGSFILGTPARVKARQMSAIL